MPSRTAGKWPDDALLGDSVEYGPKAILFRAGDRVQTLWYIVSGRVRLSVARGDGNDVTEGVRGPGWLLGLAPAVSSTSHQATGITTELCVLRPISRAAFEKAFERDGEISQWAARCLAADVADGVTGVATLGGGGGKFRLRWYVARQAHRCTRRPDGSIRIHEVLTRAEISGAIGVSVVQVGRLLRDLLADGELRREKGGFIIPPGSPITDLVEVDR